jgi:hypothetical protein
MNRLQISIYYNYRVEKILDDIFDHIHQENNKQDCPTDFVRLDKLRVKMRTNFIEAIQKSLVECGQLRILDDEVKTPKNNFVLLQSIKTNDRFFTSYKEGDEPTKSAGGEIWYTVLGYAETVEEAQKKLYGRHFPL